MTPLARRALSRTLANSSVAVHPVASEGVTGFVESLASQGGQTRQQVEKEFFEKARPTSLLKRFATPDEVAAMVVFVCSPLSSATNGAAVRVDGGVVRSPF